MLWYLNLLAVLSPTYLVFNFAFYCVYLTSENISIQDSIFILKIDAASFRKIDVNKREQLCSSLGYSIVNDILRPSPTSNKRYRVDS